MITKELKTTAIAKIHMNEAPESIAEELDIPLQLILEWAEAERENEANRSAGDLVRLAANIHAVQQFGKQTILNGSTANEELLKLKIEEVAIEIADQISMTLCNPDVMRAKALQLCADTVTKLYTTLVSKNKAPEPDAPSDDGLKMFQNAMKG